MANGVPVDVGAVVDVFVDALLSASRPEIAWTEQSLLNALEWCASSCKSLAGTRFGDNHA